MNLSQDIPFSVLSHDLLGVHYSWTPTPFSIYQILSIPPDSGLLLLWGSHQQLKHHWISSPSEFVLLFILSVPHDWLLDYILIYLVHYHLLFWGPIAFSINWADEIRWPLKFLPILKILISIIVFSSWTINFLRQMLSKWLPTINMCV